MIPSVPIAAAGSGNVTTIVAIAAGAVISLTGSAVAVWSHRSQHAFQRGETDRAELKQLMDQVVENIYQAQMTTFGLMEQALTLRHTPDFDWPRFGAPHAESLTANRLALLSDLNRLGLRLGSDADKMIDDVTDAANTIVGVIQQAWLPLPDHRRLVELHEAVQKSRLAFSNNAYPFTLAKLSS